MQITDVQHMGVAELFIRAQLRPAAPCWPLGLVISFHQCISYIDQPFCCELTDGKLLSQTFGWMLGRTATDATPV